MSVLYMVMYGPDDSHTIECAGTFKLKRDAESAYDSITGAYKRLFRLEFGSPLEPATETKILREGKA